MIVFERALLCRQLQRLVGVLESAATANTEVRAPRHDAGCIRRVDRDGARDRVRRLLLDEFGAQTLAGQATFDEHDLAVGVRDATALLVKRFDRKFDDHERRGLYAPHLASDR